MKKQILIFIALLSISVFAVVLFSLNQAKRIEKETLKIMFPSQPKPKTPSIGSKGPTIGRPEDYGIVIMDNTNKPQTQEDWDSFLSTHIGDLKSRMPKELWSDIQKKMKKEPQKKEDGLKKMDEDIRNAEEALKENPSEEEIKEKLERLRVLKSINKLFLEE